MVIFLLLINHYHLHLQNQLETHSFIDYYWENWPEIMCFHTLSIHEPGCGPLVCVHYLRCFACFAGHGYYRACTCNEYFCLMLPTLEHLTHYSYSFSMFTTVTQWATVVWKKTTTVVWNSFKYCYLYYIFSFPLFPLYVDLLVLFGFPFLLIHPLYYMTSTSHHCVVSHLTSTFTSTSVRLNSFRPVRWQYNRWPFLYTASEAEWTLRSADV